MRSFRATLYKEYTNIITQTVRSLPELNHIWVFPTEHLQYQTPRKSAAGNRDDRIRRDGQTDVRNVCALQPTDCTVYS
jgi:hypothetical protein